ncbi:MAG TPA: hypothetical protein PK089_07635 [Methanoregulaceae archaeon]|nr:hypothetical protein [Methanoregulaceae archaeon]HQJ87518.1 hypothetical protein [Methanoregulaceae archaeon]
MSPKDLERIPESARWMVCSRLLAKLPLLYDIVYRPVVGTTYTGLEHEIWIEIAREARDLADAFHLPRKTPAELAGTLATLSWAIFGRDFQFDRVNDTGKTAALQIRRCPFIEEADLVEIDHGYLPDRCLAFMIPLVEMLNPAYTLRFVRAACTGDRACELRVLPREQAEDEE